MREIDIHIRHYLSLARARRRCAALGYGELACWFHGHARATLAVVVALAEKGKCDG